MLKKISILIFALVLLGFSDATARTYNHQQYLLNAINTAGPAGDLEGKPIMAKHVVKKGNYTRCIEEGETVCIPGSENIFDLYKLADGNQLYDYANSKIYKGIHSGSYSWNITNSNGTYYRNVIWLSNDDQKDIQLIFNITEVID